LVIGSIAGRQSPKAVRELYWLQSVREPGKMYTLLASVATTAIAWIVLGLLAAFVVTIVGSRLLGARRGWLQMTVAGVVGWTAGVISAGALTGWRWDSAAMVIAAFAFGTLCTMLVALGMDLLSPPGSLPRGQAAGLVTFRNPIRHISAQVRVLRRYRSVLKAARHNGLAMMGPGDDSFPERLRKTLEDAGGMFVKLGQVASTRGDLLPPAWCEELARLRTKASPLPEETMRPWINANLGSDASETFHDFDWRPLGSASIAQVYKATLGDGTPVIVKVQRPGMQEVVATDGAAMLQLAGLVERSTVTGVAVRPRDLMIDFLDNIRQELDFRIEAANAVELATALSASEGVRVPLVYPELSSEKILVQERIQGVSVTDRDTLREWNIEPRRLAQRLFNSFSSQIFDAGLFHADPHPGNILVQQDDTIVLIDLGAVGRLARGQRSHVLTMLTAAASGDVRGLRGALFEVASVEEIGNTRELEFALEDLLARAVRSGRGFSVESFQDLVVLVGHFGIRMPKWFGTLIRTLLTLEGTLRSIDADFSLVEAAQRSSGARKNTLPGISSLRDVLSEEAMAQLPRLQRLPERVDDLLGQVVRGELSARVSLFTRPRDEQLLRTLANRLATSIICASLGIGSVILLGVGVGPKVTSTVTLNEVLGYIGMAAAAILAMRIVAGVVREE
jgi:ubiquinone biosynthesis protein